MITVLPAPLEAIYEAEDKPVLVIGFIANTANHPPLPWAITVDGSGRYACELLDNLLSSWRHDPERGWFDTGDLAQVPTELPPTT